MSDMLPWTARPVDHLVLPTASLDVARERWERLGFVVAPAAAHPFGTENVCIFLADGCYIEMLAIGQRETCEEQARAGNVFVARDQTYRFRNGQEGFSALVFASDDAHSDHSNFVEAGISAGKTLDFSRTFETPGGEKGVASFRLAFAADLRSPDAFVFACQRIGAPPVDRSALLNHANGRVSLREVVLSEENPTDFQYFLQQTANQREVNAHSFGMDIRAANCNVSVLTPEGLAAFYGVAAPIRERGLRLQGFVLAVSDLAGVESRLAANNISFEQRGPRLVVPPAPGQGAAIAFEAF
ncbi:VOC family protein [Phyllobacterium sp. 21LDTY02-6]|uniref:VOC family protein n=1 Tax=Phyllobacterium sp. 21LDTY02-6 TaxID=2944903 RepID=UPI00202282C6|nr:VOC family protein [Phyllobacterium sp. 21LDTY02-6]MCO4316534.1 VOC family protein [Phyllobacterium sp. 21LDTY02-6]